MSPLPTHPARGKDSGRQKAGPKLCTIQGAALGSWPAAGRGNLSNAPRRCSGPAVPVTCSLPSCSHAAGRVLVPLQTGQGDPGRHRLPLSDQRGLHVRGDGRERVGTVVAAARPRARAEASPGWGQRSRSRPPPTHRPRVSGGEAPDTQQGSSPHLSCVAAVSASPRLGAGRSHGRETNPLSSPHPSGQPWGQQGRGRRARSDARVRTCVGIHACACR